MTRTTSRGALLAAALLAASCTAQRTRTARVAIGLGAAALPPGTTALRLVVTGADMAPVTTGLPLDGSTLSLEVQAGLDRVFTAEAFAGATLTHSGSTTLPALLAGQETTVSIRLLPLGPPDTTPPAVVATSPANGATGVAFGALVTADFSEPLDRATVSAATFTLAGPGGAAVAGTVTLSATGTTATFAPAAPLATAATYTATLAAAVRDLAGNALAPVSWSFATAAAGDVTPPRVVSVTPPLDYSTRWIYVPADGAIEATFSEPMDPATLNPSTVLLRDATRNVVPASVSCSGLTVRIAPLAPLTPFAIYYASVTDGARDLAGNALDVAGWPSLGDRSVTWTAGAGGPPLQGLPPSPPETIAAGGTHTLARLGSGVAYAWGTNNGGALGTGQAIGALQPTPTRIPYPSNFQFVHTRSWFSEAIPFGGGVYGWGWGPPLGLAPIDNPAPVGISLGSALAFDVSAGYAHSLVLDASGSGYLLGYRVWGYGDEGAGRLGPPVGNNGARIIPGLEEYNYRSLAAGGAHSLALRSDGIVLAWGDNSYGQLGDGTTKSRSDPRPVPGLTGVAYVAAGDWFSVAVRYDRTVWAWGHNTEGQLGDGTFLDSPVPVAVTGLPPTVDAVSAGARHVLALLQDGTVRAWGHNAGGKLGDGTTADRAAPVAVFGLADVAEVSAGEFHSAARKVDGSIWTWGGNSLGQLGVGTTVDSPVPLLVPLDTTPPTVVSTVPAAEATGVPTNDPIVITFSEPIDPATASYSLPVRDPGGGQVSGTMTVSSRVLTFTPDAPLAPNTTYTVALGTWAVLDLAGNPLAPLSWSFTTGSGPRPPPAWSPSTPFRQAYFSGVGQPVVGSLSGLDFVVWNDAGSLRGAGTTYAPISTLSLPMVGQPVVLTGPNWLLGFVVYLEDAGGCPLGSRLVALALLVGSEGQTYPRSAPFTLHEASAGCYGGFSAGHLGDGIAFAVTEGGVLTAGSVSVTFNRAMGSWEVGAPTSGGVALDPACAGNAFLQGDGLAGFAQAHSPGTPQTRAALAFAARPDSATPATVCASTLDASGSWSPASPLWTAGSAAPPSPEVTTALDGAGNALVLASRASAAGAAFEMTAGYRPDAGGAWEIASLDSSGRASLPSAAFDASGNAVAVWRPGPATGATQVHAARRSAATGWGTATLVSSGAGDTRYPRVSVLADGSALALFQSDVSGQFRVWAADFRGGAWSAPALVQDTALEGRFAETVRCPIGGTFVGRLFAWRETDPTDAGRYRIALSTREQ